jgi:RNA polymerase sigma-70 factor (ECF subfamily)
MVAGGELYLVEIAPAVPDDEILSRRSDEHLPRALGLAYYILGDSCEAEEATQEAMAQAWRARRSLRRIESFEAWFDRILVNTCRKRMRRRRRLGEMVVPIDERVEGVVGAGDGAAAVLDRDLVGRALMSLTVEQRVVVVLRYWRDLSLEQISERLDWPLGTVKSRLHYALASLREQLERDDTEVQR